MSMRLAFTLVAILVVILSALVSAGIGLNVRTINHEFQDYQAQVNARHEYMLGIRTAMGYGGTIHHFKNYVLRGVEKYHERTLVKEQELLEVMAAYRALDSLSESEGRALDVIEQTVRHYVSNTRLAHKLIKQGKSPAEVVPGVLGSLRLDQPRIHDPGPAADRPGGAVPRGQQCPYRDPQKQSEAPDYGRGNVLSRRWPSLLRHPLMRIGKQITISQNNNH